MAETHFDDWIAENYQRLWPEIFRPAVLDDAVALLAGLTDGGPVLEFGIGAGRVALPLSRRGLTVHGLELSEPMVRRLQREPGGAEIPVTIGDFAATKLGTTFKLVYLVRNTITNLTTQDEQIKAFANAAAHLDTGGHFVVENYVPALRGLPPGDTRLVFASTPPTSASRSTATRSHRSPSPTTGGCSTASSAPCPPHTVTSGRRSSISWPGTPA